MNRKIKVVLFSLAIIGMGIFTTSAATLTTNNPVEKTAGAKMDFESTKKSLGDIPQGIPVEISFELVNNGTAPLIIGQVKPSCGCTNVQYPKEPINAGDKAEITAVYNAKSIGAFNKKITVYSNASEQPQVLNFSGVVK